MTASWNRRRFSWLTSVVCWKWRWQLQWLVEPWRTTRRFLWWSSWPCIFVQLQCITINLLKFFNIAGISTRRGILHQLNCFHFVLNYHFSVVNLLHVGSKNFQKLLQQVFTGEISSSHWTQCWMIWTAEITHWNDSIYSPWLASFSHNILHADNLSFVLSFFSDMLHCCCILWWSPGRAH